MDAEPYEVELEQAIKAAVADLDITVEDEEGIARRLLENRDINAYLSREGQEWLEQKSYASRLLLVQRLMG